MTRDIIARLPKAELHLHIEGTLEPAHMFAAAARNGVALRHATVAEVRAAYEFTDLQSFLDIYYQGAAALVTEQDFYDLAWAYFERAHADGVRRVEFFFDPQTHTQRGIAFETVLDGLTRAAADAEARLSVGAAPIMCFLRHLSAEEAMRTLEAALPHKDRLLGVGLDSSEIGHPPSKFAAVFELARQEGLQLVAHAGEEGPPAYIWEALDVLGVSRIDHGVRCLEDPALVERLAADRIPLTVCPLSNVKLKVVEAIAKHPLLRMLEAQLMVTVNSDDPSYFGGYLADNYRAVKAGLKLDDGTIVELARNSLAAAFLGRDTRERLEAELDAVAAGA